jgi:hypothetical protein
LLLPCSHDPKATVQIKPAIDLLQRLDTLHPKVLEAHGLTPDDYHPKLVFRSAVESIRGTYIASSLTQRQGLVASVLEAMKVNKSITDYKPQGARQRFDFEVMMAKKPKEMAAVEVKGGEGNSIGISDRPLWANEFIVWCHLDGAIINQPSHGAAAIIFTRVTGDMIKRGKQVDAVVFKDARCNTPLRPCPKYQNKLPPTELGVAPDIFLLPQAIPSLQNPYPPPHDLHTHKLPSKILASHGVRTNEFDDHIWQVIIEITKDGAGNVLREIKIFHKGKLVDSRPPRKYRP